MSAIRSRINFPSNLLGSARSFLRARSGNVAVFFSIGVPVFLLAGGGAVDYLRTVTAKSSLQALADGAALAGAQSLRLANSNATTVTQTVSGFVATRTGGMGGSVAATTNLLSNNTIVSVQLTQTVPTIVAKAVGYGPVNITAKAQAKNAGTTLPLCVVGLDPTQGSTVSVDVATINAQGCQILSDATATDSVSATNSARINSGRLCSSGGARNDGTAIYSPAPQTDCPPLNDPLATRAAPTVGSCLLTNLVITNAIVLIPGTYCGGLKVATGGSVFMLPGTYVIKDGPLTVTGGATLQGNDVSIYLSSDDSTLDIKNNSTINLAAPATGPMAGILIFESRSAPLYRNHNFQSRNAPNMLGTIYMPRGVLNIGVSGGGGGGGGLAVGSSAAWTIIVARRLMVSDNQVLNLNTNYSATNVPPPVGLGPTTTYGVSTQLVN